MTEKMSPTDRAIKEQEIAKLQAEIAADDAVDATGQGDPSSVPETTEEEEPKSKRSARKANGE